MVSYNFPQCEKHHKNAISFVATASYACSKDTLCTVNAFYVGEKKTRL